MEPARDQALQDVIRANMLAGVNYYAALERLKILIEPDAFELEHITKRLEEAYGGGVDLG